MCNVSVLHARNVFEQITVWIEIKRNKPSPSIMKY